jgi:LacI family transcriptional regulator
MPKQIKRVSLRDIALKAGVTVPTVSRILSKQTDNFSVRPEVRERVLAAVEQLNYRPNILAQSLRKTQMGIVGLLSVQSVLPYFQDIVNGLLDAFRDENITLCSTYSSIPHPVQSLPPWRIDGAIVVSSVEPEETQRLEAARIPYVCINGAAGPSAMTVSMDDTHGTRVAIEYLLRLGHRRIAYANVTGPFQTHSSVEIRHNTFVEVLREAGLSPVEAPEVVDESYFDDFVRVTVLDRKATALVAYHSYQAVYLSRAVQRLGLQIPRDVSLLSLSGAYPLEVMYPAITAVYLPFRDAGLAAGQMLVKALATGKSNKVDMLIPETFTVRQSTAPPQN